MKDKKNFFGMRLGGKSTSAVLIFLILLFSIYILIPQTTHHLMTVGDDWSFHWNRFYEAAMQIKNHKYNLFQSIYGFNQSGRVVNGVYGAPFAYLHGVLLLIVKTWYKAELFSSFLCLSTAGVGMYLLTRYCKVPYAISFASGLIYMSSVPVVIYITNQTIRSWGTAFLPVTVIPLIRMVVRKKEQINPFWLGGSFALLLSVHNLTAAFWIICSIPFILTAWYFSQEKQTLCINLLFSAIVALGLTSIMLAVLYELHGNIFIPPALNPDLGGGTINLSMTLPSQNSYGVILSLIITSQIVFIFIAWSKNGLLNKVISISGSFFFFISTSLIPWNYLASHFPILQILQFPRRFAPFAILLLLLGFALSLGKIISNENTILNRGIHALVVAISILCVTLAYNLDNEAAALWRENIVSQNLAFNSTYKNSNVFKAVRFTSPDYLPSNTNVNVNSFDGGLAYQSEVLNNPIHVKRSVTKSAALKLTWNQRSRQDNLVLPIIVYKQSIVRLNGKLIPKAERKLTSIGALIISAHKGTNTVVVGYKPTILFYLSIVVNVIAYVFFFFYCIWSFLRKTYFIKVHN
ncbi:hypothetical protein [Lacticaseibacillus paracasei]|uniref:hypothetical protein n=1 Tax=Lacticaseibacillus paracasei TaxID=1597 RepID=UPI001EDCA607|nr:hypothetical protein [Lacticaseibacillus paracasei]MCG4283303.1 hypothetical protein [Lacticaseibacillus paracasei]